MFKAQARQGTILPVALMAFAIVSFLFVINWAVNPHLKWPWSTNATVNKIVACTDEAKLCPDGTPVGRTGPKCEFAECPTNTNSTTNVNGSTSSTSDWKTFTNSKLSFKYPPTWFTKDCTSTGGAVVATPLDLSTLCGSDYFGGFTVSTVSLSKSITDQITTEKANLDNAVASSVTIDGYTGTRLHGTIKSGVDVGAGLATDVIYVTVGSQIYSITNREGASATQNFELFFPTITWTGVTR